MNGIMGTPENRALGGARQFIVAFGAGSGSLDAGIVGNKGKSLAVMSQLGFPVPPGFTIGTPLMREYREQGYFPIGFQRQLEDAVHALEAATGRRFGDPDAPLLVSVRSGAPVSMPGMMDTILNLGITGAVRAGYVRRGDDGFVDAIEQRFVDCWRETVHGPGKLSAGPPLIPDDPMAQLEEAIRAVVRSWDNPRAKLYRREYGISESVGTAVNVQQMVFGNRDERSGTGVVFSHDPTTGRPRPYGEFLPCEQGELLVRGSATPQPLSWLKATHPEAHAQLVAYVRELSRREKGIIEIEFTIESGKLWLLQFRKTRTFPEALATMLVHEVLEKRYSWREAVSQVSAAEINSLVEQGRTYFPDEALARATIVGEGTPASPGAAVGVAVGSTPEAQRCAQEGDAAILIRPDTNPNDLAGMLVAKAWVTEVGGATSHAAIVARQLGKPCVVGIRYVNPGRPLIGQRISVDGNSGKVYAEALPVLRAVQEREVGLFLEWCRLYSFPEPKLDPRYARERVSIHHVLGDVYVTELMAREAKGTVLEDEAEELRKRVHVATAERFATHLAAACAREILHNCSDPMRYAHPLFDRYFRDVDAAGGDGTLRAAAESPREFFACAKRLFTDLCWTPDFGEKTWASIAQVAESFFLRKLDHIVFIDAVFDLEHYTGKVFDKGAMFWQDDSALRQQLDAKKSARSVVELVDAFDNCWQERPPELQVQLAPEVRSLYIKGRDAHIWMEAQ